MRTSKEKHIHFHVNCQESMLHKFRMSQARWTLQSHIVFWMSPAPRDKERPQGRQPARHDSTEWSGPTWKVDGFMSSSGWFLCWWSIRVLPCLVFCCISLDKFGEVSGSSWVVFYHIAVVKTWTDRPKSLKYTHSGGYVTDAAATQPEGPGYASGLQMEDPQTTGFLSSNFWVGIYWDILGLYN